MARMIDIIKALHKVAVVFLLLVHANAGAPVVQDGKTVFPETPEDMSKLAPQLVEAGARIVGGCCGTTPAHISAIASAVK